jgi:hypothetical protein
MRLKCQASAVNMLKRKKSTDSEARQFVGRSRSGGWILAFLLMALCAGLWARYYRFSNRERGTSIPIVDNRQQMLNGHRPAKERTSLVSRLRIQDNDRTQSPVEQLARKQDVRVDNWDTEVLSEAAVEQLKQLQVLLENPHQVKASTVEPLIADDFRCQVLVPQPLSEGTDFGSIRVRRGLAIESVEADLAGASGFVQALRPLAESLGARDQCRVKFKLFRIESHTHHFETRVRYEASHHGETVSRQQTAVWLCHWTFPSPTKPAPRLVRVLLQEFEQTEISIPGGHLFVDCTESALSKNASYAQQVLPGINHWLTRIPREFMGLFGQHGLAVGDVNGDGLDDLYVCDAGGLPNRLYVQQADGTVADVSEEAGVNLLEDSTGTLLIDLDNDNDQDLVVGTDPTLQIAENDGHGRFRWRTALDVKTDSLSLCAADYDMDGDLDIYVCGYNVRKQDPTHRDLPFPLPYHDANNGGRNLLLRNDGNFQFVDVTEPTGLDANNTRFSMAAAWEDFDNDGDQDLYVANDFGRNNLYKNEGGHFTDIAALAAVEDHGSGMSVSWGDYNRDGRMDLYVGNMFSAAGNRVTYQRRFAEGVPGQTVSHLRRMARGNTLFTNASRKDVPDFHDSTEQAGVWMGRWAWASKFVDLTNDGWPDLVVANGYVTGDDAGDL